ncbi:dhdh, partial [Symbiodinium pilosum]
KQLAGHRHRRMATPLDVRLGLTKPEDVSFKLRWGILGCGPISSDWCKCLKEVPGAVLQSCAARDAGKAAKFAASHGVERVAGDYQALVADPNVDIVYIGTITPLHKEQAMMAINAGKHVLCEKPIATTAADAAELYAAAEAKGVALIEGMWTRYFPAVEHARAAIELGRIGEVRMVQADFPEICYAVQYAPLFFGDGAPSTVVSAGTGSTGAGAVIHYANRGAAVLSFPNWACEVPEVCEVIGTKGRITLDNWGMHPARITIQLTTEQCWDEPQGHTSTAQNGVRPHMEQVTYPVPEPAGLPAAGWNYVNQHGFLYQAEAVHRCLAAGLKECPQFTKAESMRIMQLLDEIEKGVTDTCR